MSKSDLVALFLMAGVLYFIMTTVLLVLIVQNCRAFRKAVEAIQAQAKRKS